VIVFRERALKDRLLLRNQVEAWIKRQAKSDGQPTAWLEIPVPPGFELQSDPKRGKIFTKPQLAISRKHCAQSIHFRVLTYGVPEDRWERSLTTAEGGVLERLRWISERLSKRYGWQKPQATIFVLTGLVPLVPTLEFQTSPSSAPSPHYVPITLKVDPSVTPRQLADYYRRFRRQVLSKRIKALSIKHLRLAAFFADRPTDEKWQTRMKAWNRANRKWKYTQESNFRRDCLQARKRVLAPALSLERLVQFGTEKT